ncbi:MAG: methionyl-tRNA formyltransferase [Ignavibacteriales bacterium]|nr:methionyl-tRNA formyltransferase [Ignavibacteriales bacterium]
MKIIFMGTPDFAFPSLQAIIERKHTVEVVVTAPDKERGRGQKLTYTPVKEFALQKNITVLQPENLRDENFINQLKEINAEVFVIVAFRILPKEVFTLPKKGTFNLHGSLLPKYRGAAPIQWAIINGETETGLTTFFLQEKVDTGNIILQEKVEIINDDNFGSLHDKMSLLGASVVLKTLELIEQNKVEMKMQDNLFATPAPKITKQICQVDWNEPAEKIHNLVRGLSPYPGAFFFNNGKQIKIYKTSINKEIKLIAGEILQTKTEAVIGCGSNSLNIIEIQPEGRKRMMIEEFLRGYTLIVDL